MLAVNLLRHPPTMPTRIVLVERQQHLGCGVAFAPSNDLHLLNVPAGRISADPEDSSRLVCCARQT